ncbi:MocR-like pyridoxine biosynthesis transcription factor PdxR [Clostridium sp. Marseille-P299]|uniref:MocR-like pyridoxine biosynthesis transcription factor PdxR n=1 Tax=Clostridium sp. Marseille-P299 TaxID=1805477 RepID=UPI0008298E4E|nr:PLP-dependent aminotransferase family protein [Clostridium sp. Marseille-P299]
MLIISLDQNSKVPMYEQIYKFIKDEIKSGNIPVHTKLPSSRNLATHLQISRSTVDLAYNQLVSEGYIESVPKSGYYVLNIGDLIHISNNETKPNVVKIPKSTKMKYDFSPFAVDISSFPFATWRKLSNQCMNDMNQGLFLLGENQGDIALRKAISNYLHESRGVNCDARRIIIGAGSDYLLQLLSQLLPRQSKICMENPTYKRAYHILNGMGFPIIPIGMKEEGVSLEQIEQSDGNIVYVTPSHQYPLGVVMPIKSRLELIRWAANDSTRYIIEDDHDSEFRYIGKPIPSLQGIDTFDRVIYMGTFSRAIAPAIRVGYMVLPEELYKKYQQEYYYYASTVSRIDQAIICEFIVGGYFERHVNKMRKHYKNKHDLLLKTLKIFGNRIRITGENAGLHLVVEFLEEVSEEDLIEKASQQGIQLYGLNRHYITEEKPKYPTILLGYANVSEDDIKNGIQLLYEGLYE